MKKLIKRVSIFSIVFIAFMCASTTTFGYGENNSYNANVAFGFGKISSYTSLWGGDVNAFFSVKYRGSSSGESFKVWFRLRDYWASANGNKQLLPQGSSFSRFTTGLQLRKDNMYGLEAGREHIINPSRNIYGTWGYGE